MSIFVSLLLIYTNVLIVPIIVYFIWNAIGCLYLGGKFPIKEKGDFMKIIHMIDDFETLCKESRELGSFEAYKRYTMKYSELFNGILKGLYMTQLENLKPMIDSRDFQKSLKIAENNYENNIVQKIINLVEEVASLLNFKEHFDIYLGLELGNIGGFSGPNPKGRPFIYIGLDRVIDQSFLRYFIPHEMNHMVRAHTIKGINMFDFMERTITEGLGSFCPIALYNMEYTVDKISNSLNLPSKEVSRLIDDADLLIDEITGEFGSILTQDKMKEYFTWSESDKDNKYYLSGYYVGMEIIKRLVDIGYDFAKLTIMPSECIWEKYKAITL